MVHLHRLKISPQRLLHMLPDSPELLDEGLIVCVEIGLVQGQEHHNQQVAGDCPVRRVGRDHIKTVSDLPQLLFLNKINLIHLGSGHDKTNLHSTDQQICS